MSLCYVSAGTLSFVKWNGTQKCSGLGTSKVRNDVTDSTIHELYQTKELEELRQKYEESKKQQSNKMSVYWHSYIDMVGLLLLFLRSIREGDWDLHLNCIRNMLPWMFAYDRINYSRYLPVYLCDMLYLEDAHPVVSEAFAAGDFVVQRSSNAFSQLPVDQTIEQTGRLLFTFIPFHYYNHGH